MRIIALFLHTSFLHSLVRDLIMSGPAEALCHSSLRIVWLLGYFMRRSRQQLSAVDVIFVKFTIRMRTLRVDIGHLLRLDHWWLIELGRIVDVKRHVRANKAEIWLLHRVLALLCLPHADLVVVLDALIFDRIGFSSRHVLKGDGGARTIIGSQIRYALLGAIHHTRVCILVVNQPGGIHIEVVEALNTASATNFVKIDVSIAASGHILN